MVDAGCQRVFRLTSIHDKNLSLCIGFNTEPMEVDGHKVPAYDVIHLCFVKLDKGEDEETVCVFNRMISMTPEEAKTIATKLILASELWNIHKDEESKENEKL